MSRLRSYWLADALEESENLHLVKAEEADVCILIETGEGGLSGAGRCSSCSLTVTVGCSVHATDGLSLIFIMGETSTGQSDSTLHLMPPCTISKILSIRQNAGTFCVRIQLVAVVLPESILQSLNYQSTKGAHCWRCILYVVSQQNDNEEFSVLEVDKAHKAQRCF